MARENLPFSPKYKTLRESLALQYILPVAKWLMRGNTNGVLGTISNSPWESAFTILFLLDTKNLVEKDLGKSNYGDLITEIDDKVKATVLWLLDNMKDSSGGDTERRINWDGLTWDTSVVLRSLLSVISHYGAEELGHDAYHRIEECFVAGMPWLLDAFAKWMETSYTAGPQDVAEILILLTELDEKAEPLYQRVVGGSSWKGREKELRWEIVEYLIKTRTEARIFPFSNETDKETDKQAYALWWGEFFGTAEVLEGLAEFYRKHAIRAGGTTGNDYSDRQGIILGAVRETLSKAILYFDYTQEDGTWGSAVTDTARVAMTYVQLGGKLSFLKLNNFVAFKALRWLCANTQALNDGSFLHSLFLTIYYAMAIMTYYRHWVPVSEHILTIYDIALNEGHPMRS